MVPLGGSGSLRSWAVCVVLRVFQRVPLLGNEHDCMCFVKQWTYLVLTGLLLWGFDGSREPTQIS
jgi:hypothetical protein